MSQTMHALPAFEQVDLQKRVEELEKRLKSALADKDCWLFNAQQLQKGYNKLDRRLREEQQLRKHWMAEAIGLQIKVIQCESAQTKQATAET